MSKQTKTKRVYKDYLKDIKTSITEIQEFSAGMTFEEFSHDRKTIHAVVRCFEIIGEAAKNLPGELKSKCPGIPWREITGMRDKMIHEYFGVNLQIVWQTIAEDLSPLEAAIKKLINQEQKQESNNS